MKTLEKRRPYVNEQRKIVTEFANPYADVLRTMTFAVQPAPSAHADTREALGEAAGVGLMADQKLKEIRVFDMQIAFSSGNLKRNATLHMKGSSVIRLNSLGTWFAQDVRQSGSNPRSAQS